MFVGDWVFFKLTDKGTAGISVQLPGKRFRLIGSRIGIGLLNTQT